jgi:hypothetical protein
MHKLCQLLGHRYKIVAVKKSEFKLNNIDSVRTVEIVRACTRCEVVLHNEVRLKANILG